MFQPNDMVRYSTHGVCKITDITTKDFGGTQLEYYVLEPVHSDHSTIYVPLHNQSLTGRMHRVLTAEEIHRIIHAMPEEETAWIENEHERKERYHAVMESGDRMELTRLIKTLYLRRKEQTSKGKKLYAADEKFLREAERLLYDEFSLVLDIEPQQVLPFILEEINLAQQ